MRVTGKTSVTFTVGELAQTFNITTRTLRFYEEQGLLSPLRRGRQRLYSQRDRTRLRLILRGRRLGFSLADIGEIVDLYDAPPGERGQLEHFLECIAVRRGQLAAKARDIDETLADLVEVENQCLARMGEIGAAGSKKRKAG
ncbi:MAG: MerR family transcriptional regulator [Alphaproteobacteria bacterium]